MTVQDNKWNTASDRTPPPVIDPACVDYPQTYATILSCALLLRHSLGLHEEADCIERAVDAALNAQVFTNDLATGGRGVSTQVAAQAVIEQMQAHCYVAELRD